MFLFPYHPFVFLPPSQNCPQGGESAHFENHSGLENSCSDSVRLLIINKVFHYLVQKLKKVPVVGT